RPFATGPRRRRVGARPAAAARRLRPPAAAARGGRDRSRRRGGMDNRNGAGVMTPHLYAGTSGFSYKPWKGPFYPERLPDKEMLSFYAGRLPAVEINNTFYRTPKRDMLATWAGATPAHFRFAFKAPQRITHKQ